MVIKILLFIIIIEYPRHYSITDQWEVKESIEPKYHYTKRLVFLISVILSVILLNCHTVLSVILLNCHTVLSVILLNCHTVLSVIL